MLKNYCRIRPDLVEQELSPPVGDNMYLPLTNQTYEYRWLELGKEEFFQVLFDGKWMDATSIDFEFLN